MRCFNALKAKLKNLMKRTIYLLRPINIKTDKMFLNKRNRRNGFAFILTSKLTIFSVHDEYTECINEKRQ